MYTDYYYIVYHTVSRDHQGLQGRRDLVERPVKGYVFDIFEVYTLSVDATDDSPTKCIITMAFCAIIFLLYFSVN